jgi:sugar lactone lactonase YvrE
MHQRLNLENSLTQKLAVVTVFCLVSGFSIITAVQPMENDPNATTVIGQPNFNTSEGSTTLNGLAGPLGICFDASGNLWVADALNNRVLEYNPPFVSGMAASLVLGQSNFTANHARAGQNGLSSPSAVSCSESDSIWIADTGNNRVLKFDPPFTDGMNSSLVIGQSDFSSHSASVSPSGFDSPTFLAVDSMGNLWVADFGNNRVMQFRFPFSSSMNASLVIGQTAFSNNETVASPYQLNGPDAVAIESDGSLWISDGGRNAVLAFNPPFARISTVLGQGQTSVQCSEISLTGPHGLVFDHSGNLWVADFFNDRVLEFAPPFSNHMKASLVIGQANPDSCQPNKVGAGGLNGPADVAFDSRGNLWVVDYHNNRLLEFPRSSLSGGTVVSSSSILISSVLFSVAIIILLLFALFSRRTRQQKREQTFKG